MAVQIINGDCSTTLASVPDGSVDLVVMDPPYQLETRGAGAFGNANREYHGELTPISKGITTELLDAICSKMRKVNIYIFCNKAQLRQYIDYFDDRGCNIDLLTWHKSNPTPTCNNKYLSDTEYIVFARDPGVPLYGEYETKRKYWVTPVNAADKKLWKHPTIKPLDIVETLITNSTLPGQTVMDPFLGSGTTAVACARTDRDFIGFEIDPAYCDVCRRRIAEEGRMHCSGLDAWMDGGDSRWRRSAGIAARKMRRSSTSSTFPRSVRWIWYGSVPDARSMPLRCSKLGFKNRPRLGVSLLRGWIHDCSETWQEPGRGQSEGRIPVAPDHEWQSHPSGRDIRLVQEGLVEVSRLRTRVGRYGLQHPQGLQMPQMWQGRGQSQELCSETWQEPGRGRPRCSSPMAPDHERRPHPVGCWGKFAY